MYKKISRNSANIFLEIKEIPSILNESYLPSLDGLRAISISMVIVFHILMSFKTPYSFDNFANLGVQFFFVISGFLITTLLIKEKIQKGNISLKNFYIRRAFRILPVAYLYLLIVLAVDLIFKLHLNLFLLLTSFLFIRNFFKKTSGANHLSTHYWSLSVEEQFYIIFPFILKKNFRIYVYFLFGIVIFSLSIDFVTLAFHVSVTDNSFKSILIQFITQFEGITIGSLTAIMLFKFSHLFKKLNKLALNLGSLLAIILLTLYTGHFSNLFNIFKCSLFSLILISNLTTADNIIFKTLNNKFVKLIGVLSYSIYIWQQPFTQGLNILNQPHFLKNVENKVPMDILIIVISLIILSAISYISYFYYEKRFLAFRKKFR